MNKYLLIIAAVVIVSSFMLTFDPNTNDVSIDEEGSSKLYCTLLYTIADTLFSQQGDTQASFDFLKEKFDC